MVVNIEGGSFLIGDICQCTSIQSVDEYTCAGW